MAGSVASLLLLADGRFPDGSHAHSYGMEAAVDAGRVHDVASLQAYIETRLWTTTRTDAAAAALTTRGEHAPDEVDAALELRMPGAAARAASRSLGRSPLQPVALGAVAALAGCDAHEAAVCTAHSGAAGLATAALRLLGMDPFSVAAVLAELRDTVTAVADSVLEVATPDELPSTSTPFAELDPELQRTIEPRLFGS